MDILILGGTVFRPLSETVRDTLGWDATHPADRPWRAGLTRQRDAELLASWKSRSLPAAPSLGGK